MILSQTHVPVVEDLVHTIGWALVHSVWQASLVAVVLAIALRIGRAWAASVRHLVACAALLVVVVSAAVTLLAASQRPGAVAATERRGEDLAPRRDAAVTAPADVTSSQSFDLRVVAVPALSWCVAAWSVGVLCLSVAQVWGWGWLRRIRGTSSPVDPSWQSRLDALAKRLRIGRRVLFSIHQRLEVPIVIGVLRPVILAPLSILNDLSVDQVEAILAHELAHVRRHDYFVNLIQSAIETLFFYHPAVWWISKQIRRERECACDEIAAAACGDRAGYAQALAELETLRLSCTRLAPALAGSGRSELVARVRRLVNTAAQPPSRERGGSYVAGVTVLITAIALLLLVHRTLARADQGSGVAGPMVGDVLKANELIEVRIADLTVPDLKSVKQTRISESGKISLPLVNAIKAAGLSERGLEEAIRQSYRDARLIANASVRVVRVGNDGAAVGQDVQAEPNHPGNAPASIREMPESAPRTSEAAEAQPATTQRAELTALSVIIGRDWIYLDRKPAEWRDVRAAIQAIPPDRRRSTYIALSAADASLQVSRYFAAEATANQLAKEFSLSHVSSTGVEATVLPEEQLEIGEYYIGGDIQRVGVYSLTKRRISLKMAMISAGIPHENMNDLTVSLLRKAGKAQQQWIVRDAAVTDLFEGRVEDVYLRPDDQIMVKDRKTAASQPAKP